MIRRGIALILSLVILVVLGILSVAFISRSISEKNSVDRHIDSLHAFWIAEAGLAEGYQELANDSDYTGFNWTDFGGGQYRISINEESDGIEIESEGEYGSATKTLTGKLLYIPNPFDNTLSVGGNLTLGGFGARVEVWGDTRISGVYNESGGASGWFEGPLPDPPAQGQPKEDTTIQIPDYDGDGTPNEFDDFVTFGQRVISDYPEDEVVYIQGDDTVYIYPDEDLVGKKVIFVEGSEGEGDVFIIFDATWEEGEDLTVISTGDITYLEPLQFQEDARLSTISWNDYNEGSIFRSEHESVIYAHDDAVFVDILDWGSTTGNIIVNGDMSLLEILAFETYYYSDRAKQGDLPPGFQRLCGQSDILACKLRDWQEED